MLRTVPGSTLSPSALCALGRPAEAPASGTDRRLVGWRSGFDSGHRAQHGRALWSVIGDRLVVGFLVLNQATEVPPFPYLT
jgi:hypothetical protein